MNNPTPPIPDNGWREKLDQGYKYIFSGNPMEGLSVNIIKSEAMNKIVCNYHTSKNGSVVDVEFDATSLFKMFLDWQEKRCV